MKNKHNGYKGMLRDRLPRTTDLALKWCKAKNKWIEHVYYNHIWWCKEKSLRDAQTRAILGLGKFGNEFNFKSTINWENLDKNEEEFWTNTETWVLWFEENLQFAENTYEIYKKTGKIDKAKPEIIKLIKLDLDETWKETLADYIIKNIKYEY